MRHNVPLREASSIEPHGADTESTRSKLEDLSEQLAQLRSMVARSQPEIGLGQTATSTHGAAAPVPPSDDYDNVVPESPTYPGGSARGPLILSNYEAQQDQVTSSLAGPSTESPATMSQRSQSSRKYYARAGRELDDLQLDRNQIENLFRT